MICPSCGEHQEDGEHLPEREVTKLYRMVADNLPREEILQQIYDLFGREYDLRPPADEARLAERVAGKSEVRPHG